MWRTNPFRTVLALLAAVLTLTLVACSASTDSEMLSAPAPAFEPQVDMPAGDGARPELLREEGGSSEADDSMVIVTKTVRLEVADASATIDEVRKLARAHQGGITDMEVASGDDWVYGRDRASTRLRGWVVVRVPSAGYDAFVTDAAALGEVVFQSEASSDVTQEHIDLSARLKNLQAQEARLREFFAAAENVDEMLKLEKELGRVRGDIESLDAQVTHLERQAAMVTVTIQLTEADAVVSPDGPSWGFVDAITNGLRGAVALVNRLLTFLIATAPVWGLGLVAFFPARAWLRKRRPRQKATG